MESNENRCLDFLRFESERIGCTSNAKSKSPHSKIMNGWEDDPPTKLLTIKTFANMKKPLKPRSITPGLKKSPQSVTKGIHYKNLTHRQISNNINPKTLKLIEDAAGLFSISPFQEKLKTKFRKAEEIHNSSRKQQIIEKKNLIIQHILPELCRVNGSFPSKFSFLKHPVKINSKKYFVIDSCL